MIRMDLLKTTEINYHAPNLQREFVKELASIINSAASPKIAKSALAGPKKSVTVDDNFSINIWQNCGQRSI